MLEIPFSVIIHGRKANRTIPQRVLLDALETVQEDAIHYFENLEDLRTVFADILQTDDYSVVEDKRRRVWAEVERKPFRIQLFLKYRFEDKENSRRIRNSLGNFLGGLQASLHLNRHGLLSAITAFNNRDVFNQNPRLYRVEVHLDDDPWANTYKPNIRARTAERILAPLHNLPQNVIRKIGSYVGTRRNEEAPRLRQLPTALRNSAIREAGNVRASKGEPEVRAASPVRNETRKKPQSWLKRLFTRRK